MRLVEKTSPRWSVGPILGGMLAAMVVASVMRVLDASSLQPTKLQLQQLMGEGEANCSHLEEKLLVSQTMYEELQVVFERERTRGWELVNKTEEKLRAENKYLLWLWGQAVKAQKKLETKADDILRDVTAGLYLDSVLMRNYLAANASQLQAAWRAQLAGQRQRGVVVSAGGLALTNAFVTLYVLRHHTKCTLPVAIMYWGAQKGDEPAPKLVKLFKEQIGDVQFIDASKAPYPQYHRPLAPVGPDGRFVGFKVKVFSLYAAPFQEVLFLDSDSMPLLDPATLFREDQYVKHGNLFYPDFYDKDSNQYRASKLFEALKVTNPWANERSTVRQVESGEYVFNRKMHWDVLEWLLFLTTRNEVVYRLVYYDKDTFRAAFFAAGKESSFEIVKQYPAFVMSNNDWKSLIQLHPNGSAMFKHHTKTKYWPYSDARLPNSTHITARASADIGSYIVFHGGLPVQKIKLVTPQTCKYSFADMPAEQKRCAPDYDENKRGLEQGMPFFEVYPGTNFAAAEDKGYEGFLLFRKVWKQSGD